MASAQQVYDLGREWYATRFDRAWQRASPAEGGRIFERHGLSGPFWSLI